MALCTSKSRHSNKRAREHDESARGREVSTVQLRVNQTSPDITTTFIGGDVDPPILYLCPSRPFRSSHSTPGRSNNKHSLERLASECNNFWHFFQSVSFLFNLTGKNIMEIPHCIRWKRRLRLWASTRLTFKLPSKFKSHILLSSSSLNMLHSTPKNNDCLWKVSVATNT